MKKYSLTITFCNIMLSSNCSCPRPTTLLVHHTLPFLSLLTQFNIRKVLFVSLPKAVLFSISLPLLFSGSVKNWNFLHFSSPICKKLQNQPKTLSERKKTCMTKPWTLPHTIFVVMPGTLAGSLTINEYFQVWSFYMSFESDFYVDSETH